MNDMPLIENRLVEEIASLLIPVVGRQLLVPTVAVAEMSPYQAPVRNLEAPDWYLGDIVWRNQSIPVVSYEVMNGEAMPNYGSACRIAVLNNTGVDDDLPFLGLATQGIPRLSRVKAEEIHQLEDVPLKRFDLMAVAHAGENQIIPNIAALEQAFNDYRKTQL